MEAPAPSIVSAAPLEMAWWLAACALALSLAIGLRSWEPLRDPVVSLKINVNTAPQGELMQLPGMNSRRARAIIAAREKRGRFSSVEELGEIKWLTQAYLARIADLIETK